MCLENEKDRPRLVGRASDDRSASKKVSRDILARYVGVYDVAMLGVWTVSLDGDDSRFEMGDGGGKQGVIASFRHGIWLSADWWTCPVQNRCEGSGTGFVVTVVEGDIPAKKR